MDTDTAEELYAITAIVAQFDVTTETLVRYERAGLLRPRIVNDERGTRYGHAARGQQPKSALYARVHRESVRHAVARSIGLRRPPRRRDEGYQSRTRGPNGRAAIRPQSRRQGRSDRLPGGGSRSFGF